MVRHIAPGISLHVRQTGTDGQAPETDHQEGYGHAVKTEGGQGARMLCASLCSMVTMHLTTWELRTTGLVRGSQQQSDSTGW